jgi:hypothetical protein
MSSTAVVLAVLNHAGQVAAATLIVAALVRLTRVVCSTSWNTCKCVVVCRWRREFARPKSP